MNKEKKSNVGIIGAGAWGTAIAKSVAKNGHNVEIWSYEDTVADQINKNHINRTYLNEVLLPFNVRASTDLKKTASSKDFLLIAVPSPFIVNIIKQILNIEDIIEGNTQIGVLTKGFVTTKNKTRLIIETLEDYLPGVYKGSIAYISGPSHAEEVARNKITGLISASLSAKSTIQFRNLLSGNNLLVFSSLDIVGVQVCAALKNVIAISFGMLDALKESIPIFGDNSESLILAAGLNEIQKLGLSLGATHPETFTSIAGVGDLDVTCRSIYGRNRRFGREIVLNSLLSDFNNIDDLIENASKIGYLPEGIYAAKKVHELSKQYKLKLPVCNGVYRVLNKDIEPLKEVERILKNMSRAANKN
jgi:glycerol-3-phosphate dehydrogenase (NAD(P)+)